ncbi:hypothetical protein L6R53_28165 [Myxococcota bacterium]|nr:hypothetical protein [Myxococcota bacterium]
MMRVLHIDEPQLEFGSGGLHIDTRYGLANFGPIDRDAPPSLDFGLVGTSRSVSEVGQWFDKLDSGIEGKDSKYRHFHPHYPGTSRVFGAPIAFPSAHQRQIADRRIQAAVALAATDRNEAIRTLVNLVREELQYLADHRSPPRVVVVALPAAAYPLRRQVGAGVGRQGAKGQLDIHDHLKATAMHLRIPIQVVWPATYGGEKPPTDKRVLKRGLQAEATRAWNITTALYYKAGGTPWRLSRSRSELTALHVGVRFYRTLDGSALHTSLAQVFDERGDGTVVRGGAAYLDKSDRQPHLTRENSQALLRQAIRAYRDEHKTLPARVVVHKSSSYTEDERDGFMEAGDASSVEYIDLLRMDLPVPRLYRDGTLPPLRGTLFSLGARTHALYTRGSVPFYGMYPGMYVPSPLGFEAVDADLDPQILASEILALTKMNWNNTQFDGRLPITMRAAKQVSDVLRHLAEDAPVNPSFRYYM